MKSEPSASPVEASEPEPSRPLRLIHLMTLTAAVALTFAAWPLMTRMVTRPFDPDEPRPVWPPRIVLTFYCWSPLLAVARLTVPRERRRWAARSYGTAAVAAATAALLFVTVASLGELLRQRVAPMWFEVPHPGMMASMSGAAVPTIPTDYCPLVVHLAESGLVAACAIVGAWSTLALTGVGRRPAGWLEWLCLAMAVMFLLFVVLRAYAAVVMNYW